MKTKAKIKLRNHQAAKLNSSGSCWENTEFTDNNLNWPEPESWSENFKRCFDLLLKSFLNVSTYLPSFITHQAFSSAIDLSLRPKVTDGIKPTCVKASCFQSISDIVSQNKLTKTFFQPIFCITTLPKVLILFSFLLLNNYSMSATCIRGLWAWKMFQC